MLWHSGRESSLLDDIIAGRKTIEGRLNRGKFAEYRPGDMVSLRRDFRDEHGVLRDGEPDAALVEAENWRRVIPRAGSAQAAANEYNKYYSAADQAEYGVLAIEVRYIQ